MWKSIIFFVLIITLVHVSIILYNPIAYFGFELGLFLPQLIFFRGVLFALVGKLLSQFV